jgi:hypothetical protein
MAPHEPAWTGKERRDAVGRHLLRRRFHSEYEELPGMSLTPDQASRLFALPADVCRRVFDELVEAGVLSRRWEGGQYVAVSGSRQ